MKPKRLDEIDENFKLATPDPEDILCWVDAFDPRVSLRGLAWLSETAPQRSFRRLPDRAASKMNEGVQLLSHCPSSAFLSFYTNSRNLSVRALIDNPNPMAHMPHSGCAGMELYLRDGSRWLPVMSAYADIKEVAFERVLFKDLPAERREFRLYLPLYKQLKELLIGIDPGASLDPAPATGKPIFIYGTSITQGGCASTAGSDFVSYLGRLLDTEVINFGFSGNGKGEPEVAELISEIDAEMFVLDFMANCHADLIRERLQAFISILRQHHPITPIVIVTKPCYNDTIVSGTRFHEEMAKRDAAIDIYVQSRNAGDGNVHFIDGMGLAPAGLTGTYVDGAHPTTHGFVQIAERLAPQVQAIRLWSRYWRE